MRWEPPSPSRRSARDPPVPNPGTGAAHRCTQPVPPGLDARGTKHLCHRRRNVPNRIRRIARRDTFLLGWYSGGTNRGALQGEPAPVIERTDAAALDERLPNERCETCAHVHTIVIPARPGSSEGSFSFSGGPAYKMLTCRRYPPATHIDPRDLNVISKWPDVKLSDRCGEWAEGRPPPTVPCPLCRGESGTWRPSRGGHGPEFFEPCDGCDGTGRTAEGAV